jgi:signal transduction histidine kinase/ActR/RegA family two-component response regulator
MSQWLASDMRVLMLAPTARDREASVRVFSGAGLHCMPCVDLDVLCAEIAKGAAAVIVPEEIVLADRIEALSRALSQQPVWSDLPVIVLSNCGAESPAVERAINTLGNVTLIERPVRITTLISMVKSILRARERQYQVRDHLADRERQEKALKEARESAEAASRAKDQFLAVLSHELRTPLSPVVLTVEAMEENPQLPRSMREDLAMVRRNVQLEAKLIDDLLDLSRVSTGKLRLQVELVSIHDILTCVWDVCRQELEAKEIDFQIFPLAASDRVIGDSARLQQVFWNLVKNAVKFTPRGKQILVRTENPAPGRIRVRVLDDGVGIEPTVLPRLFNAFEQGNPAVTRQFGGLGLGLAIAKAVVDLHGGTICAESEGHGKGASFIVELNTTTAAFSLSRQPVWNQPQHSNGKARVLLVEDHSDTARVLSQLLANQGYHVKTAGTVASALKIAEGELFDVLVSDIGLPDATGYELMQQLRQRCGLKIKGIALSGFGMDSDMQRGRDAGFDDHLVKPVNATQLAAAIQRVASDGAGAGQ